MNLKRKFTQYWEKIQGSLFPWLEEELPPLTKKQQQLISVLEVLQVEEFVPSALRGYRGRPAKCRRAVLRSFIAKAVYNIPTTRMLLDRLNSDISLRRICGWETKEEIPSESVFSRSFDDVAKTNLLHKVHENLVISSYAGEIVGHVITDSSSIEAREKPAKKRPKKKPAIVLPEGKKRRPKGYEREPTRLQKQAQGLISLEEMVPRLDSLGRKDVPSNRIIIANCPWECLWSLDPIDHSFRSPTIRPYLQKGIESYSKIGKISVE